MLRESLREYVPLLISGGLALFLLVRAFRLIGKFLKERDRRAALLAIALVALACALIWIGNSVYKSTPS